jgi:hypothetical protein
MAITCLGGVDMAPAACQKRLATRRDLGDRGGYGVSLGYLGVVPVGQMVRETLLAIITTARDSCLASRPLRASSQAPTVKSQVGVALP